MTYIYDPTVLHDSPLDCIMIDDKYEYIEVMRVRVFCHSFSH